MELIAKALPTSMWQRRKALLAQRFGKLLWNSYLSVFLGKPFLFLSLSCPFSCPAFHEIHSYEAMA
jgi:hypothetical protein